MTNQKFIRDELIKISDSITLALTKPLNQLVKPEFKEKWKTVLYPKWFVQDADDVDQAREPGLFKEEVNITSGGMVALRDVIISYT